MKPTTAPNRSGPMPASCTWIARGSSENEERSSTPPVCQPVRLRCGAPGGQRAVGRQATKALRLELASPLLRDTERAGDVANRRLRLAAGAEAQLDHTSFVLGERRKG